MNLNCRTTFAPEIGLWGSLCSGSRRDDESRCQIDGTSIAAAFRFFWQIFRKFFTAIQVFARVLRLSKWRAGTKPKG